MYLYVYDMHDYFATYSHSAESNLDQTDDAPNRSSAPGKTHLSLKIQSLFHGPTFDAQILRR